MRCNLNMTIDVSLLDVARWRLGENRGRRLLLAKFVEKHVQPHADHMAIETFGDCYLDDDMVGRHASFGSLELSPGMTWDGGTLKVPGEWPASVAANLCGRKLSDVLDHPALPRDRDIVDVDVHAGSTLVRTKRPPPILVGDLRSPTRTGRLIDKIAIEVEAGRFVRSCGLHEGFGGMTMLGTFLGAILGPLVVLTATLPFFALASASGVPDETLGPVQTSFGLAGSGIAALGMFLHGYHGLQFGMLAKIYEITKRRFGRAQL